MRIPSLYLETTIFNFPFADDAPQYRADTLQLFREIKAGKFRPFTSRYVLSELEDTKDAQKRVKMEALVEDYGIEVLPRSDEIERLAQVYVTSGVIPKKYSTDAAHLAAAAVHDIDCIVSLKFRHIVKRKTILETEFINAREGYRRVFIHTPAALIDHDQDT
jgi:predicted nucleic acid-binding protein